MKLPNRLIGKSKYHIKNSEHLVKLPNEINPDEDDLFASTDVTALFTSVPYDEMVDIAEDRPKERPWVMQWNKVHIGRDGGVADFLSEYHLLQIPGRVLQTDVRGSHGITHLTLIIDNIFMEMFKIKALATAPNPPCFWGWYVDDTGPVQKKHHIQGLFEHTKGQCEDIEEQASKCNLPMLDVMWRWEGEKISTDVYRKP